jgi:hypothetical protein
MQTIILFLDTETISYRATSLWFSILTSNSSKTHILNVMKEENTPQRWSRILTKILPQPKFSQENFRRMYEVNEGSKSYRRFILINYYKHYRLYILTCHSKQKINIVTDLITSYSGIAGDVGSRGVPWH